jgi:hypothetical protein
MFRAIILSLFLAGCASTAGTSVNPDTAAALVAAHADRGQIVARLGRPDAEYNGNGVHVITYAFARVFVVPGRADMHSATYSFTFDDSGKLLQSSNGVQ